MEFAVGKLYTNFSDSLAYRPTLRSEENGRLGSFLLKEEMFGEMPVGALTLLFLGEKFFAGVQEDKTYRTFGDWILFYKFLYKDKIVYLDKNHAFLLTEKK